MSYGAWQAGMLDTANREMRELVEENKRPRAFIGRQHPGFDVDEAMALFDTTTQKEESE